MPRKIFLAKKEYSPNVINLFPIRGKYFPAPVIFLKRSLGPTTNYGWSELP